MATGFDRPTFLRFIHDPHSHRGVASCLAFVAIIGLTSILPLMYGCDDNGRSCSRSRFLALFAFLALLICLAACGKNNPSKPAEPTWSSLGFEDKYAIRMECAGDSLYVCTGLDGLWRLNLVSEHAQWEYLGLIDSTSGDWWFGVKDVDVKGKDILVAFVSKNNHIDPGMWRSTDAGQSWTRSDSGIPGPEYPFSYAYSVGRSPHDPNVGVAINGSRFKTVDRGHTWELIEGKRGDISNPIYMNWNASVPGEVWFYGQNGYWTPVLTVSKDYGLTGHSFEFISDPDILGEGTAYDVAIDPFTGTTVYVAIGSIVCKSVDGGEEWTVPVFSDPDGRTIRAVVCHNSVKDLVYFAVGNEIYRSYDGGVTVEMIENEIEVPITSMVFHKGSGSLLVGTLSGVYRLRNID